MEGGAKMENEEGANGGGGGSDAERERERHENASIPVPLHKPQQFLGGGVEPGFRRIPPTQISFGYRNENKGPLPNAPKGLIGQTVKIVWL